MMRKLTLVEMRTDGGTQPRAGIDQATVDEYAEAMQEGATFPPVVVFHDGEAYWLADGFHRLRAAQKLGFLDIEADVRQGTQRDAVLYSAGANAIHGLRRTNADKRRAVERLLSDEEWSQWSDREIARRCGVSNTFVSNLRPPLSTVDSEDGERSYTTKHGTQATMKTERIGKGRPALAATRTAGDRGVDAVQLLDKHAPHLLAEVEAGEMTADKALKYGQSKGLVPCSAGGEGKLVSSVRQSRRIRRGTPRDQRIAERFGSSLVNELRRHYPKLGKRDSETLVETMKARLLAIAEEEPAEYPDECVMDNQGRVAPVVSVIILPRSGQMQMGEGPDVDSPQSRETLLNLAASKGFPGWTIGKSSVEADVKVDADVGIVKGRGGWTAFCSDLGVRSPSRWRLLIEALTDWLLGLPDVEKK